MAFMTGPTMRHTCHTLGAKNAANSVRAAYDCPARWARCTETKTADYRSVIIGPI